MCTRLCADVQLECISAYFEARFMAKEGFGAEIFYDTLQNGYSCKIKKVHALVYHVYVKLCWFVQVLHQKEVL